MNLARHLSANRTAKILGVCNHTLVVWKDTKGFPVKMLSMKHYKRRRWRVYVADLAQWIWETKYWGDWPKVDVRRALRDRL